MGISFVKIQTLVIVECYHGDILRKIAWELTELTEQHRETKDTVGVTMAFSVETRKKEMNVTAVISTN